MVMLTDEVNNTTASLVVAQLLYLEGQDPTKDIHLYINSPGGSVTAGMSIFDTCNTFKCVFLPFVWVWLPAWCVPIGSRCQKANATHCQTAPL